MRGYVDTDWGQLHYRRSGSGGPAIVLLHESPRTSAVYEPVMEALGEHTTTLAFDTPGFGQSDSAPAGQPLAEYARILVQALDALGVGEFVPVGMKTGSSLATAIAVSLLGTGRVQRAVLYALEEPDEESTEFWAENWAPELPVTADGSVLQYLWEKNVGLYGTDDPRALLGCVADTLGNLERYNSIYPAVFRGRAKTWADNLALVEAGVELTVLRPPWARMTLDIPIEFTDMPGTRVVEMPVSGQFPRRAPREFTAAVLEAVGTRVPA
ncbi:Pimeloyl-ACP methyl ester carboxylesterase [Rathayibacter oskolensis]|uniref:Pimeloyl-ACP methyl ester carboxylesterase n=1 Tax=Rathayibacter oskolensis TaxID=1891671 RepID=A0A1X7MV82_9MICO|nr:alpha/beta hydrolase [Rathayibacter oskolensis]SMH28281.1 Pimeloyl-ACP methyl ester carboxylesterase [Rathayibacter oskolensis]